MDSLKFHLGPPCYTLLRPAGGPPLIKPYGHFRGGPSSTPLDTPLDTPMVFSLFTRKLGNIRMTKMTKSVEIGIYSKLELEIKTRSKRGDSIEHSIWGPCQSREYAIQSFNLWFLKNEK
jgi:hypothetical protein